MPEIAINKDSDLLFSENRIWTARKSFNVLSESITAPVEFRPNDNLKAAILKLYVRHCAKALFLSTRVRHAKVCQQSFESARPFPVVQDNRHSSAERELSAARTSLT